MHFKVVIPSYNCMKWIERCLDSVATQEYEDFEVLVIDDASTDPDQAPFIQEYCEERGWRYLLNKKNMKCPYNLWMGIHYLEPNFEDVIFLLDGDDYLPHPRTLQRVADHYSSEVWLTYGQYVPMPHDTGQTLATEYPSAVKKGRSFRSAGGPGFNHPLTFRYFLFDALPVSEMQTYDGKWFRAGYDKAIMYGMLEMCSPYYRFIDEVLYCYNAVNPLSDSHANLDLCREADQIHSHPKLPSLDHRAILRRLRET